MIQLTSEVIEGFVNLCLKKHFDAPSEIPACHKEWWDMCTSSHRFVAIAAPRGHAKSTAITLSYTLATILFRQRKFVLIVSDTEAQSTFFLGNIKAALEYEDVKKLFGVSGLLKDSETDVIVTFDDGHKARLIAKGSEQKIRGINWDNYRPDLIICDDLENDEIVMNPERREKFRNWFTSALMPAKSKDGIVRYVGTILHQDALLERLMPKPRAKDVVRTPLKDKGPFKGWWYSAKYRAHPAINDFSEVLWPEYKDAEWLRHEKEVAASNGQRDKYAQEYLNIPIDESDSFFRRMDLLTRSKADEERKLNYYLSCDLAVTLKAKADYSVFIVSGMDEEGKLHVVDVRKERMDSLEIVDTILELNKRYDPDFCVFEKGSITNSILPMLNLKMMESNNYVTTHLINPSTDKVQRAQSIKARMRAGGVKFDKEAEWFPDFEQELLRFPRDIHDDQVDALSLLGLALDKFVIAPTAEEQQEEAWENDMNDSGMYEEGRSVWTGY